MISETGVGTAEPQTTNDYDSPWKEALERCGYG
jgi:hypothetical protein